MKANTSNFSKHLNSLLNAAYRNSVAPTIACSIISPKETYHFFASDDHSNSTCLFDLASLTKVLVTTLLLKLHEEKFISLYRPVCYYLPAFKNPFVRIMHLMLHTSGLPADFVITPTQPEAITKAIYDYAYKPDSSVMYSDGNYIILGHLLEKLGGLKLLLKEKLFNPLGMNNTFFCPLSHGVDKERCVKTEIRSDRGLVQGEVHDQKSYLLGGVTAQAGLFSPISDLDLFACALLNRTYLSASSYWLLHNIVIREPNVARTLGWIRADALNQMGGHEKDFSLFHTGFTGGQILLNLSRRTSVILLTNRIYPVRANNAIFSLRTSLNQLVYLENP